MDNSLKLTQPGDAPLSAPPLPGFSNPVYIGKGGNAEVYRYQQHSPRRAVAIKFIRTKLPKTNLQQASIFGVEADMMAQLSDHPSVVNLHGSGVAPDGRPYLIMEYCQRSFGDIVKQQALPVAQVLDTGVKIAAALQSAHDIGILHRDIKPSNLLEGATGAPLLTDFGIADLLRADGDSGAAIAMSVPWAAPEVIQKRTTGTVQSEVWSLGATLYTLVTGKQPFPRPTDRTMPRNKRLQKQQRLIIAAKYPRIELEGDCEALNRVLERSMRKNPAERYANMREFAVALQQAQLAYGLQPTAFDPIRANNQKFKKAPSQLADPRMQISGFQSRQAQAEAVQQLEEQHTGDRWQQREEAHGETCSGDTAEGGSHAWRTVLISGAVTAAVLIAGFLIARWGGLL